MKGMISILTVLTVFLAGTTGSRAQPYDGLDTPEQQAMYDTFQYALENNPSNQAADWVNPDTGRSGVVIPIATYDNDQGQPCREFVTTIIIGGREEQGYGTACRQPDGSWQIVSDDLDEDWAAPQAETYAAAPPVQAYLDQYYYYPGYYPERYYYFPAGLYTPYYPYNIYLSFSYIHRSGHRYYGTHYLDGRTFYRRHPRATRERVIVRPPYRYQSPSWHPRTHRHDEIRVLRPAPSRPTTQPRPAPDTRPRRDDRIRYIGPDRQDRPPRQLERPRPDGRGTQNPGNRQEDRFRQQTWPQQDGRGGQQRFRQQEQPVQQNRPQQDGRPREPAAPQQDQRFQQQNWPQRGGGDGQQVRSQPEQRPQQQNRPSYDGRSRQGDRRQPDQRGRPGQRPW